MPARSFNSSGDGPKLSVSQFIAAPTMVQGRMTRMHDQQFIVDRLLRKGDDTTSGVYTFSVDEPLFAQGGEIVAEGAEIPVTGPQLGELQAVFTAKSGLGLKITKEMRNRNKMDALRKGMQQVRNTTVKIWDQRFWTAINAGVTQTLAVSNGAWNTSGSKPRYDAAKAIELIGQAQDVNGDDLSIEADTIVLPVSRKGVFLYNDDVARVFVDSLARSNPQYIGEVGKEFIGLNVLFARNMPAGRGFVCKARDLGFIGDEEGLSVTPLYEQRERQAWRSDTTRQSAIGIDLPKAGCWITGI